MSNEWVAFMKLDWTLVSFMHCWHNRASDGSIMGDCRYSREAWPQIGLVSLSIGGGDACTYSQPIL